MKKVTKIVSLILSIMMLVTMMPVSVFAAEAETRTLTVVNDVDFKLVKASDNLPLDYVVTINGSVYTGNYELINKDGSSAGIKQTAADGTITLKTSQKAVIDAKLGDSYVVNRKQFISNEGFDGNYYNVIDADSKSGTITDDVHYYCTENGKKSEITEQQYNTATNNGTVTKVEGYLVNGELVAEAPYVTDIDGNKISYESGSLDTTSVTPIKVVAEEKSEKVVFWTIEYTQYTATCTYNDKEYSGVAYSNVLNGTAESAARIAFAQISFASDTKVALMPKAGDGTYPVYLMKEAQKVTREYTVDAKKNAVETFEAEATPALGGTASVTVAYASRNSNPVKVSNADGSDVDYNYYTINKQLSKNATSETFALNYSTGIDFSGITVGGIPVGSILGSILENMVDMDSLTAAKTSMITVEAGELGVTYTFYGLVENATYTLEPAIAVDGYGMPEEYKDGITSGSPISFKMGKPGTNTVISNYVNYTAASDNSANVEDKIVVFEMEPSAVFTKQNLQGKALAGAEFCMIERDKLVGMLDTLASMDTDWNGVYEDLQAADWSNLSWDLALEIMSAYMENSTTEDVFELPAILKATSDENGQVKFSKSSNVFAKYSDLLGGKVIDSEKIKEIVSILEKLGVELPSNIDNVISVASSLGKFKLECGMPVGTYLLFETEAPEGYLDNPIVWTVKVASSDGENLAVNNVRIGVVYDVIAEQLKANYGIDIENIIPETKFDENDAEIKAEYAKLEAEAKKAIDYVYEMLEEYIKLPDKQEFTDAVIAELRSGKSLAESVNYALSYIDGLFGRTMDEEFIIYNATSDDFKMTEQEIETVVPQPVQPNLGSISETLESVIKNEKYNKISEILQKLISLKNSK